MKRYIFSILAMMTITLAAKAMSFTQAQREALFLTDKMAYELNLTDEQYDACYEINLDYLMGVSTVDDLLDKAQPRYELYIARLAVVGFQGCHLFLSSTVLGCRMLAFRNIRTLSTTHVLLFLTPYNICVVSWRAQLENEWR